MSDQNCMCQDDGLSCNEIQTAKDGIAPMCPPCLCAGPPTVNTHSLPAIGDLSDLDTQLMALLDARCELTDF